MSVVVVLGVLSPVPPILAQEFSGQFSVAPTCVRQGVASRIVITGAGWINGRPVTLSVENGAALGTVMPRTSPFGRVSGSFTFTTSVTATSRIRMEARLDGVLLARTRYVEPQTTCKEQISLKPQCLTGTGVTSVDVSGSGFQRFSPLEVVADPFGDAERATVPIRTDGAGNYGVTIEAGFTGAAVPIVVTPSNQEGEHSVVGFLEPCPPPQTTSPTVTRPPPPVSTTNPVTTTTTVPGPGDPPPGEVPPVTIPTPDATVKVSISPFTVRPGRCAVLVVSAAPSGLPVVAGYEDEPAVNAATGPDGGVVLSLCHSHDSGVPLGPVRVLIGVGPARPQPVFTVLRVPARPQPPMLQAGADGRRS